MITVKMLKTAKGSEDGYTINTYVEGKEYQMSRWLANRLGVKVCVETQDSQMQSWQDLKVKTGVWREIEIDIIRKAYEFTNNPLLPTFDKFVNEELI